VLRIAGGPGGCDPFGLRPEPPGRCQCRLLWAPRVSTSVDDNNPSSSESCPKYPFLFFFFFANILSSFCKISFDALCRVPARSGNHVYNKRRHVGPT
jgi:hypothetical protein